MNIHQLTVTLEIREDLYQTFIEELKPYYVRWLYLKSNDRE